MTKSQPMWRQLFALLALGSCLVFPVAGSASPTSQKLIEEGVADLETDHLEEGLKKFDAAVEADPLDAKAVFFQGVAFNRLGHYEGALDRLQNAQAKGVTHPELDFEIGWSLLELERWTEAVSFLERYEQAHPGRGQTSEFLGRVYLALGDYEKAAAALNEAIRRDTRLKPTAVLYLAEMQQLQQNQKEARRLLQQLFEELPESPPVRSLQEQLARVTLPQPEEDKALKVTLSADGGYNSNVTVVGGQIAQPNEISGKSSPFSRYSLDVSYKLRLTQADTLTAAYEFLANVYSKIPTFDLRDHYGYVDYHRAFNTALTGRLRVSDEYTEVNDARFRNQGGVQPALLYEPTEWALFEVAYSMHLNDYYPTLQSQVQNRSGYTQTVALNNYFATPDAQLQARLGYFHVWNHTRGTDFSYESNGVVVGITTRLVWKITGDVSYTWSFDRYVNPNSLAGPEGFQFTRKDEVHTVSALLSRPIAKWLRIYARFEYTRENSNIQLFSFTQLVTNGGIVVSF